MKKNTYVALRSVSWTASGFFGGTIAGDFLIRGEYLVGICVILWSIALHYQLIINDRQEPK